MSVEEFRSEVKSGNRFEFGKNWRGFLSSLSDWRIGQAERSLKTMLDVDTLDGKTFLDVGSGSGLFSLAARNLDADVTSFDFDEESVACTKELRENFYKNDVKWMVLQGSILDDDFLSTLGRFDYVYSWGVLHHTGDMWSALDNVVGLVDEGGYLFVALYNHQRFVSKYWAFVKKVYNRFPFTRPFWIFVHFIYPTIPSILLKAVQGKKATRGMTVWYDLLDWLGGYPFEVSTPHEIFNFYRSKGFSLFQIRTVGGKHGCNEYVFRLENSRQDAVR